MDKASFIEFMEAREGIEPVNKKFYAILYSKPDTPNTCSPTPRTSSSMG